MSRYIDVYNSNDLKDEKVIKLKDLEKYLEFEMMPHKVSGPNLSPFGYGMAAAFKQIAWDSTLYDLHDRVGKNSA